MNHKLFVSLRQLVLITVMVGFSGLSLWAMPASPAGFVEQQPDGSEVHLHLEGDEFFHWLEDVKGYTVLKDRDWFVYGRKDETGRLVPTGLRVGTNNPAKAGLLPRELPDPVFRNLGLDRPQQADGSASNSSPSTAVVQGTYPNLVVLLRFSDHASRAVPSTGDIDILMNAPGGHPTLAPTGSVRDIYLENSYGQLALNSSVAYWVTLPDTEAYYANGNSGLTTRTHEALRFALNTLDADPTFDFTNFDSDSDGQIDAITFLHSGYAAEFGGTSADGANYTDRMWSHKWGIGGGWTSSDGVGVGTYHISPAIWGTSGTNIGRIGVICHETGHFFGLPDLYDGNDSDFDGRAGSGIGSYGMMANSWGFDGTQYYPPHMCAWSKAELGWMSPTVISNAGTYSLSQAETSASAYRIDLGYATGEYLLIENRQPVGSDSVMPQGGLAIFHIDESASTVTEGYPGQSGWPSNGNHYRVALLQADGTYDLERGLDRGDRYDVYHQGGVSEISAATTPNTDGYQGGNIVVTNNRIFNISVSGSTMTFDFEVVGAATPPDAPSNLLATATSYDRIALTWSDQSSDEIGFKLERDGGGGWIEIATVGADVLVYTDTGLAASTAYGYRVRGYNGGGNSGYSNTSNATTQAPPPPPAAPSGLAATALSDTEIQLLWTDNAGDEDGFYVDRS
ncbi:MAG: immune inhibitor A, partial [Verrucomicrobiales bacterium]